MKENLEPVPGTNQSGVITPAMIQSISGLGPWTRFLAIMGFISVGFMLIVSAFLLVAGIVGGSITRDPGGAVVSIMMTVMYVIMAVVYIFPALYLWQIAGAVVRIKNGAVREGMETALEKHRKFWKFAGILVIVFLVLYPIMMFAVIGGSMMATLGR